MASVASYKDKSGQTQWLYRAYLGVDMVTGKRKTTTRRGFGTKADAKRAATELEFKRDRGDFIRNPSNARFGQVAKAYWEEKKKEVRESTIITRERVIKKFVLPALQDKRIGAITHIYLRQLMTQWANISAYSAAEALTFMRGTFNYAISMGMVGSNPVSGIPNPRPVVPYNRTEVLFWNREQMDKFFSCIDQTKQYKTYAIFKLMALTGIRHGELVALQWSDVNLDDKTLSISKTISTSKEVKGGKIEPPKTPAGTRIIPLDDEMVTILTRWKEMQDLDLEAKGYEVGNPAEPVFTGQNNRHYAMSTIPFQLKAIIDKNNLKPAISIHKFRHSFISNMLMAGVPVPVVQRLAGHENPTVTLAVYAHLNNSAKRDAMDLYAQYMQNPKKPKN